MHHGSWSDAPQAAPGRPHGPPLVRGVRRQRFPSCPVSWGERSMRCFHSGMSGHGEKVVATNHVTPGTARAPCDNAIPGAGHSLPAHAQRPGVHLVGKSRGEPVAPQQAGVRLDPSGSTLAATTMS